MSNYIRPDATAPLLSEIIDAAAMLTFVPRDKITGPRRFRPIANARKIIYFLGRKHGYSFPRIAARLNLADHGSVVTGRHAAINKMSRDGEFETLVGAVDLYAQALAARRRGAVAASVPLALREAA